MNVLTLLSLNYIILLNFNKILIHPNRVIILCLDYIKVQLNYFKIIKKKSTKTFNFLRNTEDYNEHDIKRKNGFNLFYNHMGKTHWDKDILEQIQ